MSSTLPRRKILFLSFYFPPDLSAGSFRSEALIKALMQKLPNDVDLHVISSQPNRYASVAQPAASREVDYGGRLVVSRIEVPSHNGGMWQQSRTFSAYALKVISLVKRENYELVVATSSRLMTAGLGSFVSRMVGASLYVDIRDIFVDNLRYIFPRGVGDLARLFFSVVERFTIGRASKINLVSKGFRDYFVQRYPQKQLSWYTNGIDALFLPDKAVSPASIRKACTGDKLRVVYAGNIGKAQGLENIIPELAGSLSDDFEFVVIGDGAGKEALDLRLRDGRLGNVRLEPSMPRHCLKEVYQGADILFLHLNDFPSMKTVLPSKLFEYAASGKPILAGVSGYSAEFINREITNSAVFHPCDVGGALHAIRSLKLERVDRDRFVEHYRRDKIMESMAAEVLEILKG